VLASTDSVRRSPVNVLINHIIGNIDPATRLLIILDRSENIAELMSCR